MQVLAELKEYATEVDVDFVRKSVRAIGRCAIKIDSAAERCIDTLVDLIQTKVNYVVQEAIVVIKVCAGKRKRMEGRVFLLTERMCLLSFPFGGPDPDQGQLCRSGGHCGNKVWRKRSRMGGESVCLLKGRMFVERKKAFVESWADIVVLEATVVINGGAGERVEENLGG